MSVRSSSQEHPVVINVRMKTTWKRLNGHTVGCAKDCQDLPRVVKGCLDCLNSLCANPKYRILTYRRSPRSFGPTALKLLHQISIGFREQCGAFKGLIMKSINAALGIESGSAPNSYLSIRGPTIGLGYTIAFP